MSASVASVSASDVVIAEHITAEQMLTKKAKEIKNQLNSLDKTGLSLIALKGKGQAAKLAADTMGKHAMSAAMLSFEKSGCTNVRPFAVLINSLTGQFTTSDNLDTCPAKRDGFYDYPIQVYAWAQASKTDKTMALRMAIYERVLAVVTEVEAVATAFHAAKAAAPAEAVAA